jgi:hypothetical protein
MHAHLPLSGTWGQTSCCPSSSGETSASPGQSGIIGINAGTKNRRRPEVKNFQLQKPAPLNKYRYRDLI